MSLIHLLIAIIIAGGLSYLIRISPLGQLWKVLAWGAIAIFFLVWLLQQLRAAGIDMTI